ncbi:MAG TPA: hypothetical protein VL495_09930 [Edaphobacter sp.]|jgi:hypothetical protein|nr:hypothetical protein [Edaphobacter sp.]
MKIPARWFPRILFACLVALPLAGTCRAQSSHSDMDKSISNMVGDPAQFQTVFTGLKQAVEKHDAAAVAALISYPITINPRTKKAISIRTPKTFIARYDQIVTPHIADVIEKQKYEDLFVNDQGAMFGSGEVWIAGICKDKACKQVDIKVRTIQNTIVPPKSK